MKDLDVALENLKYDSRMVDWNIQNGVISKTDLDSHLGTLKDLKEQTVTLEIDEDNSSYSDDY